MAIKRSFCIFIILGIVFITAAGVQSKETKPNATMRSGKVHSASARQTAREAKAMPDPKLLFNAVRENAVEKVRSIIAGGADLKGRNDQGETPFMLALVLKENEIASLLMEKGSDINAVSKEGWTPLMYALRYGNGDLARVLIKKKAGIQIQNKSGWTPLMFALRNKEKECARLLIEKGADLNVVNSDGWTPLMIALRNEGAECAKLMIEKKAVINVSEKTGWTPLMFALQNKEKECARLLIEKGADLNAVNSDGWTPLMIALRNEGADCAKLMIEKGVDLNPVSKDKWTALMLAVNYNHKDIATLLIEKGAEVNTADSDGWTPLMMTLRSGADVGQLLLSKGAELNARNKGGWTPVMFALRYGPVEIVPIMIEKGAQLNVKNSGGWSPLMLSIKYSTPENSLLLIKKGAEIRFKDKDGESPLLLSAAAGDVRVLANIMESVKWKDEKDKKGNTLLHLAAENGKTGAVELLLKHGAEIEQTNQEGLTPLLSALAAGQTEAASFLLGKGARLTALAKGNSALHYAAKSGKKECVALALAGNIPVNIKNSVGATPLHDAFNREVAEYLLSQGAMLNATTDQGITPLHLAAYEGHQDVIDLLVDRGADINAMGKGSTIEEITPLYMAITNKQSAAAARLIERGANWQGERKDGLHLFFLSAGRDLHDIVKLMLAKGQNVNYRNKQGRVAIHYAASKAMLELLLANGAKLNDLDQDGASALHFAAVDGRREVVQALLEKKADIMQKTKQGDTPLHFVNDPQTAELLIANGAKLYVKDQSGMTPLEFARYFGRPKSLVSFFMEKELKQDEKISAVSENKVQVIRATDPDSKMVNSVIFNVAYDNFLGALAMMASPNISGNVGMAAGLMRSAANTGCREACYYIGEWAAAGKGMAANEGEVKSWYSKAGEMGMAAAQYWMGIHLMAEASNPKSYAMGPHQPFTFHTMDDYYKEAYSWLSAAVAQGHSGAKKILDDFHNSMSGAGSLTWEKKAAARNGQSWGFYFTSGDIKIEVKAPLVMFYESGGDKDTKGPVYGMRFSDNSTRYLVWHMELTNTKASEAIELPMTVVWYDPNGSVFRKQQRKILLAAGAESVQNEYGCGFDEPGKWKAGSYTVDFFVGQLRITRVYFAID